MKLPGNYVDGYVLPVPKARLEDYRKVADQAGAIWLEHDALQYTECVGDDLSAPFCRSFIDTIVERDLPQWGVRVSSTAMRRFWTMVAHYHGQVWNNADPARALGVSEPTARRYLDLLTDALVLRQLQPWHANLRKRQVKSPKVYVRDTGLLHEL